VDFLSVGRNHMMAMVAPGHLMVGGGVGGWVGMNR
jgi:hypothetical protein